MFWKDFLYICLNLPAALEHGKIQENKQIAAFSRVWGDKGIGNNRKHHVAARDGFIATNVKITVLSKKTIAKSCKRIQKTRDLGDFVENKSR